MEYTQAEILQTVAMTEMEHLDVRTVTLGLSLLDCSSDSISTIAQKAGEKIRRVAERLVPTVDEIGNEFGIRVANKRIAITPVSLLTEGAKGNPVELARAIDDAAGAVGVDFIGGYSALVQKGATRSEKLFLDSIPEALSSTARLCSSINAATTRAGINMDVVAHVGRIIKDAAERTRDQGGLACAKFVCFANAVEDNPFMAGAFHGVSEAEAVINVGVSGPGVVHHAVRHADRNLPLQELAETIKKLSFKLSRAGELVGREHEMARREGRRVRLRRRHDESVPLDEPSPGEIGEAVRHGPVVDDAQRDRAARRQARGRPFREAGKVQEIRRLQRWGRRGLRLDDRRAGADDQRQHRDSEAAPRVERAGIPGHRSRQTS